MRHRIFQNSVRCTVGTAAMVAACVASTAGCQSPRLTAGNPLARQYIAGETIRYVMTGVNESPQRIRRYAAEARSRVLQEEDGVFVEEIQWTSLEVDGTKIELDEASLNFRQYVSLDPGYQMTPPNFIGVNPMLIGPIFDLMTFYVDLHPDLHQNSLVNAGDAVHVPHGRPNSWADGMRVIVGEDCIDFELELESVGPEQATLRVRHVPPQELGVRLPADWMRAAESETPSNWVQVQSDSSNDPPRFVAAVGEESFDVLIRIERPSGRIVSAVMDNPVEGIQRTCTDESLMDCGQPAPFRIHRRVELRARP